MKRMVLTGLALCAALAPVGCSNPPGRQVSVAELTRGDDPGALFADGSALDFEKRRKVFRLGIGDAIGVKVANHPEFSGEMIVDGLGNIRIPTIHEKVHADGVDLDQLSDMVAEKVARFTRTPPRVSVQVLEVKSKYFYALGAVGFQGQIPMGVGDMRLRDALVRAGLFIDQRSDTHRVMVITPDVEEPTYVVVNARDVLLGKLRENVVVKPGDVVYVPNTAIFNWNRFTDQLIRQINSIQNVDRAVTFIETFEDGVVPRDLDRARRWITRGGRKGVPPPIDEDSTRLRIVE